MTILRGSLLAASIATLAVSLAASPSFAQQSSAEAGPVNPGIRIVRLSQVIGTAKLDRGIDRGFETAFANLPITQAARLSTEDGVAEVEFEDNSSLRLTPHSMVEFPILSLGRDGIRTSTIRVRQGSVYVSMAKNNENNFHVLFGRETLAMASAAHILLTADDGRTRVDVLDGSVQASDGTNTMDLSKKKAVTFDPAKTGAAATLLSKAEPGPYDAWDKQATEYHSHLANASRYGSTPYAYGLADMNYYGGFVDMGGCGQMWRPYLASASFNPYGAGTWAWYPSGYSFVSPYPWGWTAFHSGSWSYCPTGGWGWQPGSQWNGLVNSPQAMVRGTTPLLGPNRTLKAPHPPTPVGPTTVSVSNAPIVISKLSDRETFQFRNDSAGLGVPRSTFGNLQHISSDVARHGTVERGVFMSGSSSTGYAGAGNTAGLGVHSTLAGHNPAMGGNPTGFSAVHSGAMATSTMSSGGARGGFSGGGGSVGGGSMGGGGLSGGGAHGTMSAGAMGGGSHH